MFFFPLFNLQLCRMRENAPVATEPRDRHSVCQCAAVGRSLCATGHLTWHLQSLDTQNFEYRPAKDLIFNFGNHTDGGQRWKGCILDSQILEGLAVGWINLLPKIDKVAEAPHLITADLIALHLGLCAKVQLPSNA